MGLAACGHEETNPAPLTGLTMGTLYTVKVVRIPAGLTRAAIHRKIADRLERINALMSTYRADSEITRFNRDRGTAWFSVAPETALVVAAAQSISRLTHGAFDVTVEPLVNLWSFGPEARPDTVPSDAAIAERRARVGYDNLEVRRTPPALRKHRPDVEIDLSAVAKGYGVDQVAARLEELGITHYLVEIGGEVRAHGERADGSAWAVGIERPSTSLERRVSEVLRLRNQAAATSGDYRNYFEQDGQRYSHTIDPRTGRPVTHTLASVTVVAPDCMHADALATAFLVLGPDAGFDLARQHDLAALFLVREGSGFVRRATPAYEALRATR